MSGKSHHANATYQGNFDNIDDVLYVSLDNLWFENHRLEELVEFLYTHGVMHIYFDEVHKYRIGRHCSNTSMTVILT